MAVSPETPDNTLSMKEKNELEFEVLSDPGNEVARSYGVAFELKGPMRRAFERFGLDLGKHNAGGDWVLPMPATFVIDRDRSIRYVFARADYTRRAEPDDILQALQAIERQPSPARQRPVRRL